MAKKSKEPEALETDANDFHIDRDRLDVEWEKQAETFHSYAVLLANRRDRLNEAEAALDVCEAELGLAIRNDPARYQVPKVNNDAISETVRVQPEYQEAVRAVNKAKHRVELTKAAVDAMDHKKKALENMVVLHGRAYFADPLMPREVEPTTIKHIKERSRRAAARDEGQ